MPVSNPYNNSLTYLFLLNINLIKFYLGLYSLTIYRKVKISLVICEKILSMSVPPDHLLLDSAPNLGPLIYSWEINKFENC
jgi:hypothetical protein